MPKEAAPLVHARTYDRWKFDSEVQRDRFGITKLPNVDLPRTAATETRYTALKTPGGQVSVTLGTVFETSDAAADDTSTWVVSPNQEPEGLLKGAWDKTPWDQDAAVGEDMKDWTGGKMRIAGAFVPLPAPGEAARAKWGEPLIASDGRTLHTGSADNINGVRDTYPMPQESGEAERDGSGVLTGNTVA